MSQMQDSHKNPAKADEIIETEEYSPTPFEKQLNDWIDKAPLRSIENCQAALTRMVTLSSALLAGSVVFLKSVLGETLQKALIIALLLSLIISILGSVPWQSKQLSGQKSEVVINQIASRKEGFMMAAYVVFFIGILVIAASVFSS